MTTQSIIAAGKEVYNRIKPSIELSHPEQFVAIDPISKEYFMAPTIGGALAEAQRRYPSRQFYTVRIGEERVMTMSR